VVSFLDFLKARMATRQLTITRILLAILLTSCCSAEDRNWEEANSLLVKASGLEAFKPDAPPKFHLRVSFVFRHTSLRVT